jgi:hypothetical protein
MVDLMLGPCTKAGADAGNEHTGLNVIILPSFFVERHQAPELS